MPTSFPGSLFSRSRGGGGGGGGGGKRRDPGNEVVYMLHAANPSTKLHFQTLQFLGFAAFFAAYVLTEALFVKRKVVIWVVVSVEAIKLRSEVAWIEIISTLLLCWLYIHTRHGIFLNVFVTIRSTNSLVSSSLLNPGGVGREETKVLHRIPHIGVDPTVTKIILHVLRIKR